MQYRDIEPLSKQLTIIVGLAVVGIMAFGLTLSFYRNVLFEQTLQNIHKQNDLLREKITQEMRDLEYYRSAQYKDKYAKENFGLLNPGEKVLIITQSREKSAPGPEEKFTPTQKQRAAYEELLRQMPVIEHWKLYLFHREKIDELQRSL
jgi:hypothetical protein